MNERRVRQQAGHRLAVRRLERLRYGERRHLYGEDDRRQAGFFIPAACRAGRMIEQGRALSYFDKVRKTLNIFQ